MNAQIICFNFKVPNESCPDIKDGNVFAYQPHQNIFVIHLFLAANA